MTKRPASLVRSHFGDGSIGTYGSKTQDNLLCRGIGDLAANLGAHPELDTAPRSCFASHDSLDLNFGGVHQETKGLVLPELLRLLEFGAEVTDHIGEFDTSKVVGFRTVHWRLSNTR